MFLSKLPEFSHLFLLPDSTNMYYQPPECICFILVGTFLLQIVSLNINGYFLVHFSKFNKIE